MRVAIECEEENQAPSSFLNSGKANGFLVSLENFPDVR